VPLPLLPVVGACWADWRLLLVDELEPELVVVSVVVVVVCAVAVDEAFPA
jgi:hypothetical protein